MTLHGIGHAAPSRAADVARRVFLATSVDLSSNGIGALFLRDLMASQAETAFAIHEEQPFLMGDGGLLPHALMRLFRAAAARAPRFQSMRLRFCRTFLAGRRAATIAAKADAAQAERIWITASSAEMIWVAERLAAMGRDLRVTVWDAPEYLSGNLRLNPALHEALMRGFGSMLRQARAVSVIGHAMHKDYRERYGVVSEIIRHGIEIGPRPAVRKHGERKDIRIVFAGSLYSKEEWNSFVAALEEAGWRVGDRPVSLHFMGRFPLSAARKPKEVVFLGEKPFEEALEILSTMDIGYLPYWFDERHKLVASTSFPGKMTAYTAAGLAIFHHAPPYTEVTAFLEKYKFGISCASLDACQILKSLDKLADMSVTEEFRQARRAALKDELSSDVMSKRFKNFIN